MMRGLLKVLQMKMIPTVGGCEIHFAPPKKPWNGLIPCKHQQTVVSRGFLGGCRISSINCIFHFSASGKLAASTLMRGSGVGCLTHRGTGCEIEWGHQANGFSGFLSRCKGGNQFRHYPLECREEEEEVN